MIGAPVSACACATARMIRSTPAVSPWWSMAHLKNAGLDGGALDALADVAHEQVDQRLRQAG